jgi:predicted Na+-dependent transporter
MISRLRSLAGAYPELTMVLVAAALGLVIQPPLAWLAGHEGISVLLAMLVFATALTIDPAALKRVVVAWRSLAAALLAGITVLPALSWAVAQIAPPGPLREGLATIGLAPCEIASVATTAMAGGEAALAAGVLIGSTVTTVLVAGPALRLEAVSGAAVLPAGIIASLALVVAAPLAAGLALRWRVPGVARLARPAGTTAMITVALLVALIAAEVRLSAAYAGVAVALLLFLAGSAVLGALLGTRSGRSATTALLLTTSMRDFAIAAGLAAAAFGVGWVPAVLGVSSPAPLGLYGILVLTWGTAVAGFRRSRGTRESPGDRG